MVNSIVFPPGFIEEGVRINTECYIRMLDDVYLPHCMARLGTDTSSWWWQEDNAPSGALKRFLKCEIQLLAWPPCSPDLSHPCGFHQKAHSNTWLTSTVLERRCQRGHQPAPHGSTKRRLVLFSLQCLSDTDVLDVSPTGKHECS